MRQSLIAPILFALLPGIVRADPPADLALATAVTGVPQPIAVRNAADGSGRLFVLSRDGRIWIKAPTGTGPLPTPFLNISASGTPPPFGVGIAGEGGVLGLAFHPNYETNRQFYVGYTDANNDTVVVRYTTPAGTPNVADPGTVQVVIRIDQDSQFHKGGDLHFGPDGFLYIALGDGAGGSGTDGCNRAQTLNPTQLASNDGNHADCPADGNFTGNGGNARSRALLGKILRIDVSGTTAAGTNELCASNANGSANYSIPAGNPFAGSAVTAGNCDEIWAYGLRNPFRFSFDRQTGDMLIGDVGESAMEEVDLLPAGTTTATNFGWDLCEGTIGNCGGSTPPILTYTPAQNPSVPGCNSITGGFRYRGNISGFNGIYVFSDYCSGKIRFGTQNGAAWSWVQWLDSNDIQHTSFGEDESGELYLAEINSDRVLRFTSAAVGVIFANGFE